MRPPAPPRSAEASDLQGWSRLAFDATLGLTGVVEAMHRGVTRLPGLGPGLAPDRTRGLTGLVYRSIRGVTRLAGLGVDLALSRVGEGGAVTGERSEQREALLAALNGVVGDHLAATDNPLAIPMRLRRDGRPLELERQALAAALPGAGGRPLLLVHGSCLDDLSFRRGGHDLGAALARDLGLTPVSLRYNTGLHVSTNGRALADLLEALLREWPVPVERLTIVAHSMGGLLARSACHYAAAAGQGWLGRLGDAVFLGTPHHGTPLERAGRWLEAAVGVSRYSRPLARLGKLRSAGVTDLAHGSLLDEDWVGRDRFALVQPPPRPVPLPAGVRCFTVAAAAAPAAAAGGLVGAAGDRASDLVGDGLVSVQSALGRHPDTARDLGFPEARRFVARGVGHVELLSSPEVYDRVKGWLSGG